jgi:hypothetical protein
VIVENKNIYQRINAIMKDCEYLQKKGAAQGKGIKYDEVMAMLRDLLIKHGVVMVVNQKSFEPIKEVGKQTIYQGMYQMDLVNMDNPSDLVTHTAYGQGMDGGDKAAGKAHTYAVKIMLVKGFGIETGDDEESRSEKMDKKNTIDQPQLDFILSRAINENNMVNDLGARILSAYKIQYFEQLPASKFKEVQAIIKGAPV